MGRKLADDLAYPPRGMEVERAAAYVGFGKTKFLEMVDDGRMPKPVYFDGSPRWDRLDLDAAFEDIKQNREDPVKRGRELLHERLRQQQDDK